MWVVLALVLPAIPVVFALSLLTVRTIAFFRQVGKTGRALGAEVERVVAAADLAAAKADAIKRESTELEASIARLRASQSQLSILLSAWSDVRQSVGRVTAFVPRK